MSETNAQPRAPEQAVEEVERGQALIGKWHIKAEELKAEVERLREALRDIRKAAANNTVLIPEKVVERIDAALAASPEPKLVECDQCGGTGFDTPGTGYGNVCSKCGGQRYVLVARAQAKNAT